MGSKTSSYLEDGSRKHWQGSREEKWDGERKVKIKGDIEHVPTVGNWHLIPLGPLGDGMGLTPQTYLNWGTGSWGTYPSASLPLLPEGYFLGILMTWLFQLVVLGKKPRGTEIQISAIRSLQEHTKSESQEEYRWGANSFSFTEVAGVNSRKRIRWIGARRLRGQGHMRGLWLWSRWRSELGKWEGRRSDRWGRERLGRYHQQDLATDLACTHVGGKLPETDSKQCSTTVTTFLNLW